MENQNSVAYIAKINKLTPIEGADKIVLAQVEGWTSVVQKGVHQVGDMVLCITMDAVIPEKLSVIWGVQNYLRKGIRVRTVKLRGVYSECILIPLFDVANKRDQPLLKEGQDMMEKLEIFKYEPPAKNIQLPGNKTRKQKQNPNFSVYYKFPNLKNVPHMFNEEDEVVITRKIHGTNTRYGIVKKNKLSFLDKIKKFFGNRYVEYTFCYGSHNVLILSSNRKGFYETDVYGEIGKNYNMEQILWDYVKPLIETNSLGTGIIVYGEIYGAGIQGEKYSYGLDTKELVVFDIEFNGTYLNRDQFENVATFYFQLPKVEVLYRGKWSQEIQDKYTFNQYIDGTKIPHEGIVISHISGDRHKVAKVINPDYHTFAEKFLVPDSH
jgi:RNA ligase (TIGR02306 family)